MIDESLMDEVVYFSEKKKYIEKDLIRRILFNLIESSDKKTKNNFKTIEFMSIDWNNTFCTCNPYSGTIKFDYDKCIKDMGSNICTSKAMLINNLDIVRYLIHEYQHLLENSKENKNNLEMILIIISDINGFLLQKYAGESDVSIELLYEEYKKIYMRLYNYIPAERIADIGSYKLLLDSLYKFKDKYRDVVKFITCDYVSAYKRGYRYSKTDRYPTYHYLDYLCKKDLVRSDTKDLFIDIVGAIKDMDLKDKFKYGLPTTSEDVKVLKKRISKEYE